MKTVYMPRVIDARYLHDYFIHIVFSNGKEGNIDLKPFIGQGVFEPLTNKAYFKKLFVDGWTISWKWKSCAPARAARNGRTATASRLR